MMSYLSINQDSIHLSWMYVRNPASIGDMSLNMPPQVTPLRPQNLAAEDISTSSYLIWLEVKGIFSDLCVARGKTNQAYVNWAF